MLSQAIEISNTTIKAVHAPPRYTDLASWPESRPMPVVLGVRLAEQVDARPGAITTVRLPPESGTWIVPSLQLRVAGTFSLQFAEFKGDAAELARRVDAMLAAATPPAPMA